MITSEVELAVADLFNRMATGMKSGYFPGPAGSIVRLFAGVAGAHRATVEMELSRESALVWDPDSSAGERGINFIKRQGACLGGGSLEMARNLISERVLGMPREAAADHGIPFRDVPRNG